LPAATKEGKVVLYTSIDLEVAAKIVQSFGATYPASPCSVEPQRRRADVPADRPGAESKIYPPISSNRRTRRNHLWKRLGWLDPFVPTRLPRNGPPTSATPMRFASGALYAVAIAYNTKLVKADQAPKSLRSLDKEMERPSRQAHPATAAAS